jgi:hypothetical protein
MSKKGLYEVANAIVGSKAPIFVNEKMAEIVSEVIQRLDAPTLYDVFGGVLRQLPKLQHASAKRSSYQAQIDGFRS